METESYPFCFILRRRYLAGFLCQRAMKRPYRLTGRKSILRGIPVFMLNSEKTRKPKLMRA
ncbi:MAG: hypothetical protein FWF92_03400 [Oscillospiraceae bacterium]|nr:hypothetical protein [Oscillospiraceae bacterium]